VRGAAALLGAAVLAPVGCSAPPPAASTVVSAPATTAAAPSPPVPATAHRVLAAEPAQIADDLVADEAALRDPASPEDLLTAAAHRQQAAYRLLGRHPEWDPVARPRIPPSLLATYDRNIDARRQLDAMSAHARVKDTLPAWRIVAPLPAGELLGYYREAQAASGVDWSHLAAINLIETLLGRVAGVSTAGAQGPMQFLPSTFASYGNGGDIHAPRDSIMAAGRFLAAHGFDGDRDSAVYRYNNSTRYVRAVDDYAAVLAADPGAFAGYYRWQVYVASTAGDVVLPTGYSATSPVPVADYLAAHPQPDSQPK
jgi:soluble lytic murein transglycosylase-like protein